MLPVICFGVVLIVSLLVTVFALVTAQDGYEDERGYHASHSEPANSPSAGEAPAALVSRRATVG